MNCDVLTQQQAHMFVGHMEHLTDYNEIHTIEKKVGEANQMNGQYIKAGIKKKKNLALRQEVKENVKNVLRHVFAQSLQMKLILGDVQSSML